MFRIFAKGNKYNACKVTIDGHTFASKRECARYQELKDMQSRGEIANLVLQPSFTFPMGFKYTPDFQYEKDGRLVCEDVKGVKTRDFILRAKCFQHFFPVYRLMINQGREWVEFGTRKPKKISEIEGAKNGNV